MKKNQFDELKVLLDKKVKQYNQFSFIENDPISVPHRFSKKQDIEIAGLFAAVFSWGNRKTIINKSNELMNLFDDAPHEFVLHHSEKDLKKLLQFKHRTFNTTDLLYFIHFLKKHFSKKSSLENAFIDGIKTDDVDVMNGLIHFHDLFFSDDHAPKRTRKHIPTPLRNSSCKRLNMYLRWMIRNDHTGVDFGLWNKISSSQLIIPLDVHVQRVALKSGLMKREIADWKAAVELTNALKLFDAADPVKYDFALFGMGVNEKK
mgnify:CR=1 FL=1